MTKSLEALKAELSEKFADSMRSRYVEESNTIAATIKALSELQEIKKEVPGGLFEIQNIKSDARAISKRLGDALERNSRQAIELQKYRNGGQQ